MDEELQAKLVELMNYEALSAQAWRKVNDKHPGIITSAGRHCQQELSVAQLRCKAIQKVLVLYGYEAPIEDWLSREWTADEILAREG